MSLALKAWSDDPLTSANDAKGAYIQELQHNTNFVREQASLGLGSWTNASAGRKFVKDHMDEIQGLLEEQPLLDFYEFASITEILGHSWSALPTRNQIPSAGYALMNDMRRVIDAYVEKINDTYEFQLVAPGPVSRGVAFDLIIQSVITETQEPDTAYVPENRVNVWLTDFIDGSIVPTSIDNTGWVDGARTISCTVSGIAGAESVGITVRDDTDFRRGEIIAAVDATATTIQPTAEAYRADTATAIGDASAAFWQSAWDDSRSGTGAAVVDKLLADAERTWLLHTVDGAPQIDMLVYRIYCSFDVSAVKGTVKAAKFAMDAASNLVWFASGVQTPAAESWQGSISVIHSERALAGVGDVARYQDILALAEGGTGQSQISIAQLLVQDGDQGEIIFNIDADSINNVVGDFYNIAILTLRDLQDDPHSWPGLPPVPGGDTYGISYWVMTSGGGKMELRVYT